MSSIDKFGKIAERRQRELLVSATELFLKKGFEETSVNQIAEEIGVSKGLFYHYFKDKNQIFDRVICDLVEKVFIEVKIRADATEDFHEKLAIFIDGWFLFIFTNSKLVSQMGKFDRYALFYKIKDMYMDQFKSLVESIINQGAESEILQSHHALDLFEIAFHGCAFTAIDVIYYHKNITVEQLKLSIYAVENIMKLEQNSLVNHLKFNWKCNI